MTVINNYDKVEGSGVANVIIAEPASGRKEQDEGKFIKTCPTAAHQDGWTIMTWKGENGGPGGYALTNGVSSLLFDENGNCKTATGKPGDTGCGGKIVRICTDFLDKGHSYAGQFTGSSQERTEEGTEELPTYSLHVTGETAIESIGGDVNILGDNVTIQARKTLTLKAGTAIAIEAGNDKDGQCSGQIDVKSGKYTIESSFYKEVTKGHHKEIDGEFTVNQTKPGSKISFNSQGTINSKAGGNYNIGCDGRFNIDGRQNVLLRSKRGGASIKTKGKFSEKIGGIRYTEIKAQPTIPMAIAPDAWEIKVAAGKTNSIKIKAQLALNAKFMGGMNVLKFFGKTDIKSAGPLTIKGTPIMLN